MAEVSFKSLQNLHESLLQKQQKVIEENQQEFVKEVREYIEQAKRGGSNISSTRERDQVRANLRYWGNYIYSIDKTFPDTELAPSMVADKRPISSIAIIIVVLILVVFGAIQVYRSAFNRPTETPSGIPTFIETTISTETQPAVAQTMVATGTAAIAETSTPEPTGFNVTLSSPANGDSITPNIEFRGTFENLKPGWAIHVLFIREDKYFPIKESYTIPDQPASRDWIIKTQLTASPEEMSKAQSYSIVLAVALDISSSDLLADSSETGIDIYSVPPTTLIFDDTARVIYRPGFVVIRETRLVYPVFDGDSYDLFTSRPDGSDIQQITFTPGTSELSPRLSPDGTKIVYVHNVRSIHIMDSNGQNDRELINGGKNVLENPQWSPDASHISYTFGDTSLSSTETYWSIHVYQLSTGEDRIISGEPGINVRNRYHSWIPESNMIIFNAGTQKTGSSGFIQTSIDTPENLSIFFDTPQEEIQPVVNLLGSGYLLTYTVVNPDDFSHDIYAVIASSRQSLFDGLPIRLTKSSGKADYPILEPNSKVIYYIREGNIFKVEFNYEGNKINLIFGVNVSEPVVKTGQTKINLNFDINLMDTFFPIP